MARRSKSSGTGYRSPPRRTRFKPGKSGNPKGRPQGSKNFDTALAKELGTRVTITENGRQCKATKQTAIIKQLTNKAASGDLKATQTILKVSQPAEATEADHSFAIFDTAEDHLVIAEIVQRIRSMDEIVPTETSGKTSLASTKPQRKGKK